MRNNTKILFSLATSLAISALVVFLIFSILQDVKNEALRVQTYSEIKDKITALNIALAMFPNYPDATRISQIESLRASLGNLFRALKPFDNREELLLAQIRTNAQELGYAFEKFMSVSAEHSGGMPFALHDLLVSQLWMKTQFISDDTSRLAEISQTRINDAQRQAAILILVLIVSLILINFVISFFSGRSIYRVQEVLRTALAKAEEERRVFESMMEHIPIGITIAEQSTGTIRAISRHGCSLTGRPRQQIEGIPLEQQAEKFQIYGADGSALAANEALPLTRATRHGEVIEQEEWVMGQPDGSRIAILCTAAPIRDAHGNITGGVIGWQDITERKKAEQKLRKSQERLRLALDAAYLISFEWDIIHNQVHRFASRDSALPPTQERAGTFENVLEAVHPEDRDAFTSVVLAAMNRKDGRYENEFRIVQPDGNIRWLHENGYFERDAEGRSVRLVGLSQDITERKKSKEALEAEQARLRATINSIPLGVWIADVNGRIVETNHQTATVWGEPDQAVESIDDYRRYKGWFSDTGVELKAEDWAMSRALTKGEIIIAEEVKIQRFDGRLATILNTAAPIRNTEGRIIGGVVVAQDITERKQAEQALRHLSETLEQQVAERTQLAESRARQLQALAVELIEAEERERQRIAGLLHEDLQQLLAGAKFMLQSAAHHDPILREIQKVIEDSIQKSRYLSHELSPAVLHQLGVGPALQWLSREMKERYGLTVQLTMVDRRIESTPLKVFLFRAVQELLFNIVKHSGVKNARVKIAASDNEVITTVTDAGKGFDTSLLETYTPKAGLGLLTLRERASYLGGTLTIESTPGQGSRLMLRVPVPASFQPVAVPGTAGDKILLPAGRGNAADELIRILFVDDHKVMRQGLIRLITGRPGIEILGEASNGREALEMARQLRPNLIVMDISMPEIDGIEATRLIKAEMPDIRVIGLSMFEDEHTSQAMRHAGAEAFVSKAASSAELLKAIYGMETYRKVPDMKTG